MYRRLLVTVVAVLAFRVGQNVPLPGVRAREARMAADAWARHGDLHRLVDLLSGGALLRLTVLGLGVWPVAAGFLGISLLSALVPRLAELRRAGRPGRERLARHAVVLGLVLAFAASCFVAAKAGHLRDRSGLTLVALACCLTAGAALTLLLMEWITERGLGDGFTVLLLTQVSADLPRQLHHLGWTHAVTAVVCALVALAVLVPLRRTARMVPVQHARQRGVLKTKHTYVPVRVVPSTFVPMLAAGVALLGLRAWTGLSAPWYLAVVFGVALVFAVLAAPTGFSPERTATELARARTFVPGIRPGRPTQEFFAYLSSRVTLVGTLAVPVLTLLVIAPAPSAGALMLIVLIVALRTFEQALLEVRTATAHVNAPLSGR
ncbi:hypothetical protein AB0L06_03825 [Spirillospora sp. NPDC052269]